MKLVSAFAWIGVFLVLCATFLIRTIRKQVHSWRRAVLRRLDDNSTEYPEQHRYADEHSPWAAAQGFSFVGHFVCEAATPGFIAAWENRSISRYFCVYYIGRHYSYDLFTHFTNDYALTTANGAGGNLFPTRPGKYLQTLCDLSLPELFEQHLESERLLMQDPTVRFKPAGASFEDAFMGAIRAHTAFVESIPLWSVRTLGWFFFRRAKFRNLTLAEQAQRGLTTLAIGNGRRL